MGRPASPGRHFATVVGGSNASGALPPDWQPASHRRATALPPGQIRLHCFGVPSIPRVWKIMTVHTESTGHARDEFDPRAGPEAAKAVNPLTRLVEQLLRPGAIRMDAQP